MTNLNKKHRPRTKRTRSVIPTAIWDNVAGIDVHKDIFNICIATIDETDTIEYRERNFTRDQRGITQAIHFLQANNVQKTALESTAVYHKILVESFEAHGITTFVINPSFLAPRSRRSTKRDRLDAKRLTRMLFFGEISLDGEFKPSYLASGVEEALKKTVRLHDQTVQELTRTKNRIHKLFDTYALGLRKYLGVSSFTKRWLHAIEGVIREFDNYEQLLTFLTQKPSFNPQRRVSLEKRKKDIQKFLDLASMLLTDADRIMLSSLFNQYNMLGDTISQLKQEIKQMTQRLPSDVQRRIQIADSLPGVSSELATRITLEFGDMKRFSNRRKASRYTGLDVAIRSSGGKVLGLGQISKAGNRRLRRHLFMAARNACRNDRRFRAYYKRMRDIRKLKHTQVICAIARKYGELYYFLVKNDQLYESKKLKMKHPHKTSRHKKR